MPPPTPAKLRLLERAADLRAAGAAWDKVAEELGRPADVVRRWPAAYPADWRRLVRAARERVAEEARAEAVLVLRQLLRSDDEKVRRDAAKELVGLDPPDPAAGGGEAAELAAFVGGLSDAEVDALVGQLAGRPAADAGGPPDPAGGAGGPARPG